MNIKSNIKNFNFFFDHFDISDIELSINILPPYIFFSIESDIKKCNKIKKLKLALKSFNSNFIK